MDENIRVTRAAGIIGFFTFLSRVLGLARDMLIANFFGSGMSADAFFVAFRIPNLLRRLFAEGSFSVSFVPVFTGYLQGKTRNEAFVLARVVLTFLCLILAAVAVLGVIFAPFIVKVIAWGFGDVGEKYELTVLLTRVMFPYIFLVSLLALFMGILNSLDHFSAPALAPVFLNLAMIGAMVFLVPHMKTATLGLALGVLGGGILQVALQIPFMIRKGLGFLPIWDFRHPGLKKIGLLMLPAIFGSAIYQINNLVITLLASFLKEGSISYLYYADRLVQFPLGIFAIAISTAVLPSLSREAAQGNMEELKDTLCHALRLTMFITMPAMAGLIVLREPIIRLLFQRGEFDHFSTIMTARALLYYSLGLLAFSGLRVFVSAFYSLQDTKTPVKVAFIAIIANIAFALVLMGPLEHGGLALALSLASTFQLLLLVLLLRRRLGGLGGMDVIKSTARSALSSVVMGLCVYLLAVKFLPDDKAGGLYGLLAGLFLIIGAGVIIYVGLARLLGSRDISSLKGMFKKT